MYPAPWPSTIGPCEACAPRLVLVAVELEKLPLGGGAPVVAIHAEVGGDVRHVDRRAELPLVGAAVRIVADGAGGRRQGGHLADRVEFHIGARLPAVELGERGPALVTSRAAPRAASGRVRIGRGIGVAGLRPLLRERVVFDRCDSRRSSWRCRSGRHVPADGCHRSGSTRGRSPGRGSSRTARRGRPGSCTTFHPPGSPDAAPCCRSSLTVWQP